MQAETTPTTAARPAPTARTARPVPPWAAPVAAGVAALGACVIAGLTDSGDTWLPGCPFRESTGLDCPGCGMTRGLRALTRGDLAGAADHNLLLVVLLPVVVVGWGLWLARSLGLTQRRGIRWEWRFTAPILVGSIVAFWVLRDLPFAPFSWLASGS